MEILIELQTTTYVVRSEHLEMQPYKLHIYEANAHPGISRWTDFHRIKYKHDIQSGSVENRTAIGTFLFGDPPPPSVNTSVTDGDPSGGLREKFKKVVVVCKFQCKNT